MVTRMRLSESAIRSPQASPLNPPKTSEWMTPSRAQASIATGSSGTMGMWKVTRSPVSTPPKSRSKRGELVDPPVQLVVGDRLGLLVLGLGHPDDGGLVRPALQVAVDAVVAGVEPPADEPLPEGRVAGVERGVPVAIPAEQVGVLPEALGEVVLPESIQDGRVRGVGLADEARRRLDSTPPPASGRRSGPPRPPALRLLPFAHPPHPASGLAGAGTHSSGHEPMVDRRGCLVKRQSVQRLRPEQSVRFVSPDFSVGKLR